ncbi:MAG: tRNA (adenosine(37)-N6)-threonylcarbamoyltransferase complex dimerization subunit type 1 TsaB [Pseudomonadota bacterium]
MTTLIIDCCQDGLIVGLFNQEGAIVSSIIEPMKRGQAEALMPAVSELLAFDPETTQMPEIDRIIVTHGVGSFVGARVGLAGAQGLAIVTGAPVYPVSTLTVWAWEALKANDDPQTDLSNGLTVILPGGREEVFFQTFRWTAVDGSDRAETPTLQFGSQNVRWRPIATHDARAVKETELKDHISLTQTCVFTSHMLTSRLGFLTPEASKPTNSIIVFDCFPSFESYWRAAENGEPKDTITPLYVRPPDAKPARPLLQVDCAPQQS